MKLVKYKNQNLVPDSSYGWVIGIIVAFIVEILMGVIGIGIVWGVWKLFKDTGGV